MFFLVGTNQGKTEVHQTQMGFISYVVLCYVPGKEKVSLYSRWESHSPCGSALLFRESLPMPTALLFACLSPSESHPHTSRSFLTLFPYNFVPPQCSKSVANLTWQGQIHLQRREVLHHHLLMRLSDPQATPTHHSSPPECTVSSPMSHTHHPRVSKQTSRLQ